MIPDANFGTFWDSAFWNVDARNSYVRRIAEVALNRYKWTNLLPGMNERYLEAVLVRDGAAVVFYEENTEQYLNLAITWNGQYDAYGNPIEYMGISYNGDIIKNLNQHNSVIIYNNFLRTSDIPIIVRYSNRLWDIERNIEVNANQQKFSKFIACDETERLTLKNLIAKYDGHQPFIYGTKALKLENIKVISPDIPYIGDKLYPLRNSIYNDAMNELGVLSFTTDKRERLTVTESTGTLGSVELIRNSYTNARETGAKLVNEMFGSNLQVEFNSDIPLAVIAEGGGSENGSLYRNSGESGEVGL